jgi:putative FmdB family regulatory protein
MPIYEYMCNECGKKFERIESFNDDTEIECQYCPGRAKRVVSQSSFVLKGTGWYQTDYAQKSTQKDTDQKKDSSKESKSKEVGANSDGSSGKKDSSKDVSQKSTKTETE